VFSNQNLSQIDRKTVRVIERERGLWRKFSGRMLFEVLFKNAQTAIQCPVKQCFFVRQYLNDLFLVRDEFRKDMPEFRDDSWRQLSQETR
jgi:hypothetical protein